LPQPANADNTTSAAATCLVRIIIPRITGARHRAGCARSYSRRGSRRSREQYHRRNGRS
jgi:hypothetical protein